jgi:hypothetical protein
MMERVAPTMLGMRSSCDDKADMLVQCDYNQAWTAVVHCKLLSAPVRHLFENDNREGTDWEETCELEPRKGW